MGSAAHRDGAKDSRQKQDSEARSHVTAPFFVLLNEDSPASYEKGSEKKLKSELNHSHRRKSADENLL